MLRPPIRIKQHDPVLHVLEHLPEEALLGIEFGLAPLDRAFKMHVLFFKGDLPCMELSPERPICGLNFAKLVRTGFDGVPIVPEAPFVNVASQLAKGARERPARKPPGGRGEHQDAQSQKRHPHLEVRADHQPLPLGPRHHDAPLGKA